MHCDQHLSGNEMLCVQRVMYGQADLDQGAAASHAFLKATFLRVFCIMSRSPYAEATSLMCDPLVVWVV